MYRDCHSKREPGVPEVDWRVSALRVRGENRFLCVSTAGLSPSHFFRPQEHLDLGGTLLHFLLPSVLIRSAHERLKQRMRLQRLRFEFRMELTPNEKRMTRNLHDLNVSAVRSRARNAQPGRHHGLFILTIELVAMPMPLADLGLTIDFVRQRPRLDLARPCPQPHRATQLFHAAQLAQLVDHAMRSRRIELTRVSIRQSANVARKFNAGGLHPQTDPEVRDMLLARVLDRLQHAFDAPLAESPGHKQSVVLF